MTPREKKIAVLSAAIASLIVGLGPKLISEASAAIVSLHNVHFYKVPDTDGGFSWAMEACAKATAGDAGAIVDEGCVSGMMPQACKVDCGKCATCVQDDWKVARGIP